MSNPLRVERLSAAHYGLADRFYRESGYKLKCTRDEVVIVLRESGNDIVAAVRLLKQRSGHFWMRNLLVHKLYRGKGLGRQLVDACMDYCRPFGCYCFAVPQVADFYHELGFQTNPPHCPDDIRQNYERYHQRGRDWLLLGKA